MNEKEMLSYFIKSKGNCFLDREYAVDICDSCDLLWSDQNVQCPEPPVIYSFALAKFTHLYGKGELMEILL